MGIFAVATQIGKWGNSLAVRIPSALAEQLGLKEGSPVEIITDDRGLLVRKPGYRLEDLLAGITPENLPQEPSPGPAVGGTGGGGG